VAEAYDIRRMVRMLERVYERLLAAKLGSHGCAS
jgi:hypothetical protein